MSQEESTAIETIRSNVGNYKLIASLCRAHCDNLNIMTAAVSQSGNLLALASKKLRGDGSLVLAALDNDPSSFKQASNKIKKNPEISFQAVMVLKSNILHIHPDLRKDKDFFLKILAKDSILIIHAHKSLKNDKEVIYAAIKGNNLLLQYASEEIQSLCAGSAPDMVLKKIIDAEKLSGKLDSELPETERLLKKKKI